MDTECRPYIRAFTRKTNTKSAKFETIFAPSQELVKRFLSKPPVLKVRLVTGPSNMLFAGVYVCTFHPGNFKGGGSQAVKKCAQQRPLWI